MSQDCIEYDEYKKMIEQQSATPRRNIFEENRQLTEQIQRLAQEKHRINVKLAQSRNFCLSIIDAIRKVYSEELAAELQEIMDGLDRADEAGQVNGSILEAFTTHQSQPTASDWSQSRRASVRTPEKLCEQQEKRIMFEPLTYREQSFREREQHNSPAPESCRYQSLSKSPLLSSRNACDSKQPDPSTNRSHNRSSVHIVATCINCELCLQTFGPNQFIEHASRCSRGQPPGTEGSFNSEQTVTEESSCTIMLDSVRLEDTQDRRFRKQSQDYMKMMQSLAMIQREIEQQIQLIKCSKEKIDRDAEKRKLEKDLAKVMYVIEQKKKQGGNKENLKSKGSVQAAKLGHKGSKNTSLKIKI